MQKIDEANVEVEELKDKQGKELWIFFDEINSCLSNTFIRNIYQLNFIRIKFSEY